MQKLFVAVLATLILSACTTTGSYNAGYLNKQVSSATYEGKAFILTDTSDDQYVFSGHPTSFSGGGTTLNLPLGQITRELSVTAFAATFTGGIEKGNTLPQPGLYSVIVKPKIHDFTYEYNQAKNLGFAVTPTVTLSLDVAVVDPGGNQTWQKSYASGVVEGPSYMVSTTPGEEISKTAHNAIYKMLSTAAADIADYLKQSIKSASF